jgi:predicted transcriptional regulator
MSNAQVRLKNGSASEADFRFKNRSGLEILASIISAAVGGARKTHVMYRANLSHSQLQRYLAFLESRGLVRAVESLAANAPLYEATERGMQFLRDYEKLGRYLNGTDLTEPSE